MTVELLQHNVDPGWLGRAGVVEIGRSLGAPLRSSVRLCSTGGIVELDPPRGYVCIGLPGRVHATRLLISVWPQGDEERERTTAFAWARMRPFDRILRNYLGPRLPLHLSYELRYAVRVGGGWFDVEPNRPRLAVCGQEDSMNDDTLESTTLGSGEALAHELLQLVARELPVPDLVYNRLLEHFRAVLNYGAEPGGVVDARELVALAASLEAVNRRLQRIEPEDEVVSTGQLRRNP